jgi:hypothetical protein
MRRHFLVSVPCRVCRSIKGGRMNRERASAADAPDTDHAQKEEGRTDGRTDDVKARFCLTHPHLRPRTRVTRRSLFTLPQPCSQQQRRIYPRGSSPS